MLKSDKIAYMRLIQYINAICFWWYKFTFVNKCVKCVNFAIIFQSFATFDGIKGLNFVT